MVYVGKFLIGKTHIVKGDVGDLHAHKWGIDKFHTWCGLQDYFYFATRGKFDPKSICKRCAKLASKEK